MKQGYGDRIKELRLSQNLTLEKFAKKIGTSKATAINYEKNGTIPDISTVGRMVREFGLNSHWLITGKGDMILKEGKEGNDLSRADLIQKLYTGTKIDDNLLEILEAAEEPILRNEMTIAVILAKQKYADYFEKKSKNSGKYNSDKT